MRPPPVGRTAAGRRYEWRLLELTAQAVIRREYCGLAPSQFEAWNTLVHLRSPQFAKRLRGWLRSGTQLSALSAQYLAWMGLTVDRPALLGLLKRAKWSVRGHIAQGLGLSVRHKHVDPKSAQRSFVEMAPLVCGEVPVPRTAEAEEALRDLCKALVSIDRRRALELFRSPRALHARNPAVRNILLELDAIRQDGPHLHRPLDPELLWPIFEALRRGGLKLPLGSYLKSGVLEQTLGLILILAAELDPVRTLRECRVILDDRKSESSLRDDAKQALKLCKGAPDPAAVMAAFVRKPRGFGPRVTKVLRVLELADHCVTDGLALYFANLGEHWRTAAAGLEMMGCGAALKILREAGRLVESFESLKDSRSAMKTAENVDGKANAKLDKLGERMDAQIDAVRAAAEREMSRNPREYRRR